MAWDWTAVTPRQRSVWRFSGALGSDGAVRGSVVHGPSHGSFAARRVQALS
jgi:hypothetical protein